MLAIQGLKCIYDTGSRSWAMELALEAEGENAVRRFDIDGPEDAEMLIRAFEESTTSGFDPHTGEIVFGYDFIDLDDEEDDEDEDEEAGEDDEEDEDDEDEDEDEDDASPESGRETKGTA